MENQKPHWKKRFTLKRHSKKIQKHARRAEGATIRHARRFLVNRWDKVREVRIHAVGWLAGIGVLIAIVGLQMVWFQQSYITTAPVRGGTYAEAVRGPIETVNPMYATSPAELAFADLVFSSLYSYDTTGHLRGDVATEIQSKNDQEFTVKLRRDAHWHDGKPLTARDVVFTINLMRNPAARAVAAANWQGIVALYEDEYTVKFVLPASYAAFQQALTFPILPEHLLKDIEPSAIRESKYSTTTPVGSGPFSFQLIQTVGSSSDRKIVYLSANNTYYQGKPQLDRFQLHTYKDEEMMSQALKTGEVSGASDVSSDVAKGVDTSRYEIVSRPVNNGVYVIFNMTNPVLKERNVRNALLMATNTEEIRKQLYGEPRALHLPFIPDLVEGSEKIPAPKFDMFEAERVLNKAGWKMNGDIRKKKKTELRFRIVTRQNTEYENALKNLVKNWSSLGIKLDIEVFDTSDVSRSFPKEILQPRNYDILLDEMVIGADPDVYAFWHSGGFRNFSQYGSDVADDTLTSARDTSDPMLRNAKYITFAKQWLADIPAIGLYQSNLTYVHAKSTRTLGKDEYIVSPNNHYANVLQWTAEKGRVYKTP